jgi:hypothetical protein
VAISASGLLVLSAWAPPAGSQAWVQAEGAHYLKVSAAYFRSTREFNFRRDRQPIFAEDPARSNVSYRDMSLSVYGEYGISDALTLVGAAALKNARTWEDIRFIAGTEPQQAIRTNYGFSDATVSLRRALVRGRLAAAVQTGLKLPLGYDPTPANDGAPLGTGRIDADLGIHAGLGLHPMYVDSGAGYRIRRGSRHDQVLINGEAGVLFGRLFSKVRLEGLMSTVTPPDIAGAVVQTPVSGEVLNQVVVGDHDLFKVIVETSASLGRGFRLAGEMSHALAGKNTLAGTTWALGIIHEGGSR